MSTTQTPTISIARDYWSQTGASKVDTQQAETAITTDKSETFYTDNYMPSAEYQSKLEQGYYQSEIMDTYKRPELDQGIAVNHSDSEWSRTNKTVVVRNILNRMDKDFANKDMDLRNLLFAYNEIAHRSGTGYNYHQQVLGELRTTARDNAASKTVAERDSKGKLTGKTLNLDTVLADDAKFEQYINDPAVRSALRGAIRTKINTEGFQKDLVYDKNNPGAGTAIAGTLGAGVLVAGLGFGVPAFLAGNTLAFAGAATTGAFLISNPIGWGILAVAGIAALAGVFSTVKYMASGRNDYDGLGSTPGFLLSNYVESLGFKSNQVQVN